jgi:hypothetical protein
MNQYQLSVLEVLTDPSTPNLGERQEMLRRLVHEPVPNAKRVFPSQVESDPIEWAEGQGFFTPLPGGGTQSPENSKERAQCWADQIVNEKRWCTEGVDQILRALDLERWEGPTPRHRTVLIPLRIDVEHTLSDEHTYSFSQGSTGWLTDDILVAVKEAAQARINLRFSADNQPQVTVSTYATFDRATRDEMERLAREASTYSVMLTPGYDD